MVFFDLSTRAPRQFHPPQMQVAHFLNWTGSERGARRTERKELIGRGMFGRGTRRRTCLPIPLPNIPLPISRFDEKWVTPSRQTPIHIQPCGKTHDSEGWFVPEASHKDGL